MRNRQSGMVMRFEAIRALPRALLVIALAVVVAGCGGMMRVDSPAQVEERTAIPSAPATASASETTQIAAYTPPAAPQAIRAEPRRAVAVLIRRAGDQRRAGDFGGATVSLERALRIAPDDPLLWHQLAEVRAAQQRHELVAQLAAKSNALADPADRALRGSNWRLIAQSRRALGDHAGALSAERRAALLQ